MERGEGAEFLDEVARRLESVHKSGQPELERLAESSSDEEDVPLQQSGRQQRLV